MIDVIRRILRSSFVLLSVSSFDLPRYRSTKKHDASSTSQKQSNFFSPIVFWTFENRTRICVLLSRWQNSRIVNIFSPLSWKSKLFSNQRIRDFTCNWTNNRSSAKAKLKSKRTLRSRNDYRCTFGVNRPKGLKYGPTNVIQYLNQPRCV